MSTFGIIGMGRMGQSLASLLDKDPKQHYHTFNRLSPQVQSLLEACDVVIEFTTPDAAPGIIRHCLESGIAVVSGTTGWQEYHLHSIIRFCQMERGKFLYASNFSIGMNIAFALNRKLASMMDRFHQFRASVKEIHHIHKKDAPSGTAYTLIGDIIDHHKRYKTFELGSLQLPDDETILPVAAVREGDIKGYHEVTWDSGSEQIKISHEAFDRAIFAEGAIMAATWLINQPSGVYTMKDIIDL